MSTLLFGLVLGALALFDSRSAPGVPQPATARARRDADPVLGFVLGFATAQHRPTLVHAILGRQLAPSGSTETAVERGWSVLGRLGIGLQPPRKVLTGKRARIRWWHRIFSLALLLAIVVLVGLALASFTAILIVAGGFLLEQAIG
ncbi:MAG: hypothetical protein H8E59_01290 [Actinobacteria bacterium]|nr:hypothetical protein [Actinomycetota bacterium]